MSDWMSATLILQFSKNQPAPYIMPHNSEQCDGLTESMVKVINADNQNNAKFFEAHLPCFTVSAFNAARQQNKSDLLL